MPQTYFLPKPQIDQRLLNREPGNGFEPMKPLRLAVELESSYFDHLYTQAVRDWSSWSADCIWDLDHRLASWSLDRWILNFMIKAWAGIANCTAKLKLAPAIRAWTSNSILSLHEQCQDSTILSGTVMALDSGWSVISRSVGLCAPLISIFCVISICYLEVGAWSIARARDCSIDWARNSAFELCAALNFGAVIANFWLVDSWSARSILKFNIEFELCVRQELYAFD